MKAPPVHSPPKFSRESVPASGEPPPIALPSTVMVDGVSYNFIRLDLEHLADPPKACLHLRLQESHTITQPSDDLLMCSWEVNHPAVILKGPTSKPTTGSSAARFVCAVITNACASFEHWWRLSVPIKHILRSIQNSFIGEQEIFGSMQDGID